MRDSLLLGGFSPDGAIGKVAIEFYDPLTGKIKERVTGENHVHADVLKSAYSDFLGSMPLCITDSQLSYNSKLPYLLGKVIGYGYYNSSASGTYCGAYVAGSSYYNQLSINGLSSKITVQYLPSQALGVLGTIGLTGQWATNMGWSAYEGQHKRALYADKSYFRNSDYVLVTSGQYVYSLNSASGVLTKRHETVSTISVTYDISSNIPGFNSSQMNYGIGYNPANGRFYIQSVSSVASNRKLYEYSDDTFTTLLNTYNISNYAGYYQYSFIVYGNFMYIPKNMHTNGSTDAKFNFVTNTVVPLNITTSGWNPNISFQPGYWISYVIIDNRYLLINNSYNSSASWIFDLLLDAYVGTFQVYHTGGNNYYGYYLKHPFTTEYFYCQSTYNSWATPRGCAAATHYQVPSGVVRPAGTGMTVSYELDVYF